MKNHLRQAFSHVLFLLFLLGISAVAEAATITVTNNGDSGAGSLRDTIATAAAGDTIDFSAGITLITLTSGEIGIGKNLTISGPGARILTISGNSSSRIFNITTGTVVISGVALTNGVAPGSFPANGGAIYNTGDLTLNKVAVTNSTAMTTGPPGNGGGIANSGTMTLNEVTVSGNSANSAGGGIYNEAGIMVVNNSTVSGNTSFDGSGIYNYSGGSSLTLRNSTITGNSTSNSGSAALDHDFGDILIIYNTILADNGVADLFATSTPPVLVHNSIIGVPVGGTTLGSDTSGNLSGTALLEPLLNNGGPTDTHAPLSGSPALNAGDVATCLATDQRGVTRPLPTSCDIGAVEPTCNWTNPSGGPWSTIGNWDCGHVPDGADHVNITLAGSYTVDLDQAGSVLDMMLGAGSGAQTLRITGGSDFSLSLAGASTIAAGGVLSVANQGSQVSSVGLLTNNGAITLDNGTFVSANLKNTGTLTVTGANPSALNIGGYASSNSGTITANGPFTINMSSTGSYANTGIIDTGAGNNIVFNGTGLGNFTNSSGGVIMGAGTVDVTNISSSTFSSAGEIKPAALGTTGQLSVTGNMAMTGGNLYIDISGSTTPGTDYDQVSVSGAATLNGTLNVALNSYDPPGGSSFAIMTCGSGCDSGTFVPNLPALTGGKSWNVAYNPASVVLSVVNETIAPTDNGTLSALAGDAQVALSWIAASDSGGSGVASYLLAFSTATAPPAGCSGGSDIGNVTSYNHSSLTNGTTYHYRVCAKDGAGNVSTGLVATAAPVALLSQAIGTISFAPSTLAVGDTSSASATGGGSGNPVIFSSATPSVCTAGGTNGSTITAVSAGTCTIKADQAGNASYYAAPQVSQNITINKATPVITWANPADITYGTALSGTQLNATASVPGSFVYTPASGSVLNAGAGQTLSATFTPSDTNNYNGTGASVTITVNQASVIVTLGNLAQTYDGTAKSVSVTTVPAGHTVDVIYNGSAPVPVNAGSYAVAASVVDANYTGSTAGTLVIGKATPVITWPTASTISYGQTLASSSLSGGSSVPAGTFAFTAPTTVPNAGTALQSVTFTPSDTANYNTASGTVSVTVNKANSNVSTWPTASAITYGQTLASSTLTGGTPVTPGTFAFTAPTTAPSAGTASQSVTFTPTDTANYNSAASTVSVTVSKADAAISWPTASAITYGQTLASSALTGGTSTPVGTFAWTTPATALNAGTASQSVTFTPTDTVNYNSATSTVSVTVNKATPVITWGNPSAITYGTALSGTQLNATASVPGSFVYSPASGTVLNAGAGQTLSATFTPGDTSNYNSTGASVGLTVDPAAATISLGSTAQTYDGSLKTVSVTTVPAGLSTLVTYDGSVAAPANAGSYAVAVSISDPNYSGSTGGTLVINKATPVISWANPAAISYGTALSGTQLNATASVPGSFVYAPASGTVLNAGAGQTLSATFTPSDTANYNSTGASVSLTVNQAAATISLGSTAQTYDGSLKTVSVTTVPAGLSTLVTYDGSVAAPANAGSYAVAVSITDPNYSGSTSGTLVINKATPVISWANPAAISYGTALSGTQLNATASVPGSFVYSPASGTVLNAGAGQTLSAAFTPSDTSNYTSTGASVSLTVNALPANQVITGADGRTTVPVSTAVAGANLAISAGTLLTDASGNPIMGSLTVTASVMNSIGALPTNTATAQTSDGKILSVLGNSIDITISAGASTVKTINPPMIVTLPVASTFALPGATVSYYSFDGTKWQLEGTAVVKSDNSVDMIVGHLSVWAVAVFAAAVDSTPPVISSFAIPATSSTLLVPVSSLIATDDVLVTGYLLSESATIPQATDSAWTTGIPTSFTFPTWGNHTLYAYAKDAAGNISAAMTAPVYIGSDPAVDGVVVPALPTAPPKLEPQLPDAMKSLNFAMKVEIPTATEILHGDVAPLVNGVPQPDGKINLGDTIVILRRVVGL